MRNLIFQVIASWQVWVVTIVVVIYISLVRYVSRVNTRRSRPAPAPKAKKEKAGAGAEITGKEKPAAAAPKTDELGLEEGGDGVTYEEE